MFRCRVGVCMYHPALSDLHCVCGAGVPGTQLMRIWLVSRFLSENFELQRVVNPSNHSSPVVIFWGPVLSHFCHLLPLSTIMFPLLYCKVDSRHISISWYIFNQTVIFNFKLLCLKLIPFPPTCLFFSHVRMVPLYYVLHCPLWVLNIIYGFTA